MASKTDVTVYIGRFTPFHLGHVHVLKTALANSRLVIMLFGSADMARSLKNPFTYEERKQMVKDWLSDEVAKGNVPEDSQILMAPLRDEHNNSLWIRNVQKKVRGLIDVCNTTHTQELKSIQLIGSDRDDSTWYLKSFPQWELVLIPPFRKNEGASSEIQDISATEIRELMFSGTTGDSVMNPAAGARLVSMLPETTYTFLMNFVGTGEHLRLQEWQRQNTAYKKAWAVAPHPPIFTTVDAVVVQSGHILVVQRGAEPGKGLWALPGGFLDTNERLRNGVVREILEETGIRLADGKKAKEITEDILRNCIREMEVFDAPDRSMRGRTITHAFYIRLDDTKPLPKVKGQNAPLHETGGIAEVETLKAKWMPISEALNSPSIWFEDHYSIISVMVGGKDL